MSSHTPKCVQSEVYVMGTLTSLCHQYGLGPNKKKHLNVRISLSPCVLVQLYVLDYTVYEEVDVFQIYFAKPMTSNRSKRWLNTLEMVKKNDNAVEV